MTIKDIAKSLDISYSTVSKCLNNEGRVSAKTRARVLAEVQRTGFVLNANARGLVKKQTGRIGVVFTNQFKETANRWFFGEIETYSTRAIEEHGYDFFIQPHNNIRGESNVMRLASGKQVDGLLIFSRNTTQDEYDYLLNAAFPHAYGYFNPPFLNTTHPDLFWDDNFYGGYLATRHLIENGHRNILTLRSDVPTQTMYDERTKGYMRAMREAGLATAVVELPMDFDGPRELLRNRLDYVRSFTAVFAQQDQAALSLMQELRNRYGVHVPEDLSIVGYNNIDAINHFGLPLDTVEDPREEVIRAAVESLVKRIGKQTDDVNRMYRPKLVVRASVKPLAAGPSRRRRLE